MKTSDIFGICTTMYVTICNCQYTIGSPPSCFGSTPDEKGIYSALSFRFEIAISVRLRPLFIKSNKYPVCVEWTYIINYVIHFPMFDFDESQSVGGHENCNKTT